MTNWHDPALEIAEGVALIKLIHVFAGVYLWEFVMNFDYEYSIITGKRKFTRSIPATRFIWDVAGALDIMTIVFAYFSFLFASSLVILRIYALWEQKKAIVVVTFAVWLGNSIAFIYIMAVTRAYQVGSTCGIVWHVLDPRVTILSSFTTELSLLSLMLLGVLRWKQARRKSGTWRVLYTQGLIYIVVVILADVPNVIFILLNLNEPMDLMFNVPGLVVMSIGALRLYRGLIDSPALSSPPAAENVGMKEMVDIRFAAASHPAGSREEGTHGTGGAMFDSTSLSGGVQQIWFITKQGDRSSGSETA